LWRDDAELLSLMRQKLFPAVVGDILDNLGFHQQFLPREIQPLAPHMVVAGRAVPVLHADLLPGQTESKPFGLMLDALDDLKPGEVYFATGGSPHYALWGELMSTRAMHLGAAGAVLNGSSRDTHGILRLDFPTFAHGRYAQDQKGRGTVLDFRVPVQLGGVRIEPGTILFGDIDGVLAIPREAENDVLREALEKVEKENLVRVAIENGMSTVEAFAKYGVM
jgi:regulator of RNase E activity RraA